MTKTKEYTNGELTIVWKPELCTHSGVCVRTLPKVYDPKAKPWISIDQATTEALIDQIKKCPSGALSYYMNNETKENKEDEMDCTKAEIIPNGPLIISGTIELKHEDGNIERRPKKTAICRCGATGNMPFCDGSHRNR